MGEKRGRGRQRWYRPRAAWLGAVLGLAVCFMLPPLPSEGWLWPLTCAAVGALEVGLLFEMA